MEPVNSHPSNPIHLLQYGFSGLIPNLLSALFTILSFFLPLSNREFLGAASDAYLGGVDIGMIPFGLFQRDSFGA